jgi:ABC-type uncharacterized transport system involved in gliding motility auxiliary subunit
VESVDVNFFTTNLEGRLINDKGLLSMISYYGATLEPSLVLDVAALPMPYRDYSQQLRLVRYPPWVGVLEDQANYDHPLCSGFAGVDLFWTNPINLTLPESGKVRGEVLFTSTPEAWLMTDNFSLGPDQVQFFAYGSEETEGEKILAVALEGIFPSWFEGMEKPRRYNYESDDFEWEEMEDVLPPMPVEPKEARIVVIGDTDMMGPLVRFTQPQQSANLDFLLKVADWLGKDDDIIGIRNRSGGTGRLDRITDDKVRQRMMRTSRIMNIFIIPSLIMIFGITRLIKRNYKKERDRDL